MSYSFWFSGQITLSRQDSQQKEEDPHRDNGAGNGMLFSLFSKILGQWILTPYAIRYIYIYIYLWEVDIIPNALKNEKFCFLFLTSSLLLLLFLPDEETCKTWKPSKKYPLSGIMVHWTQGNLIQCYWIQYLTTLILMNCN